jgi:ATP-binding cassette subfamily F protein uup
LSFKEQREFDGMEAAIAKAEAKLEELETESAQPALQLNSIRLTEISKLMAQTQAEIDRLYKRWEELGG